MMDDSAQLSPRTVGRRYLLVTTGDPDDAPAAAWLGELCRPDPGAEVTVLFVFEPAEPYPALFVDDPFRQVEPIDMAVERQSREAIAAVRLALALPADRCRQAVQVGDLGGAVLALASRQPFSAVVLARHPAARSILRRRTDPLAWLWHRLPCPLVTIRPRGQGAAAS